jgi:hypothetical protein
VTQSPVAFDPIVTAAKLPSYEAPLARIRFIRVSLPVILGIGPLV